jgi:hypothetical protein
MTRACVSARGAAAVGSKATCHGPVGKWDTKNGHWDVDNGLGTRKRWNEDGEPVDHWNRDVPAPDPDWWWTRLPLVIMVLPCILDPARWVIDPETEECVPRTMMCKSPE